MNYKKFVLTIATLLYLGMAGFAEIAVKDVGGGEVEITFTYKDDTASEMGAIGSFNNWTVPGLPMARNAANLWEITIKALSVDEIQYKFYNNGAWLVDERSPDSKDDGFGGKNGLIIVADILSGVTPAVPGVVTPIAKVASKSAVVGRPKVAFGTVTYIESDTAFDTNDGKFDALGTALNAKSVWKFKGDMVAGMPGYIELTTFNGHQKLVDKSGLDADDGFQSLAGGLIFNPFYYLGDNKRPTLDKFSYGFDTPWVLYETGYANSTLPVHKNLLWDTVDPDKIAGEGYSSFKLGPKFQTIGDVILDAGLVPNKSLGSYFGLYSFASVEAGIVKAEVQYEMKASTKTEAAKMFEDMARQNILAGATIMANGFSVTGQGLYSMYLKDTAIDKLPAKEKMAAKAVVGYGDYYQTYEVKLGYDYRGGEDAKLLYGLNDDVLGLGATQKASLNGFYKIGYWFTGKLDTSAVLAILKPTSSNIAVSVQPGLIIGLDALNIAPVSFELATKLTDDTKPSTGEKAFNFRWAGAKVVFGELVPGTLKGIDVYYKLDNSTKDAMFNTVLTEFTLPRDLKAQAGFGLRSGNKAGDNPYGASFGVSYIIPVPAAKTPSVYAQFVYNMDPYNAEGSYTYDITDFGPDNGITGSDGSGAVRLGVKWDF